MGSGTSKGYDIDEDKLKDILSGKITMGKLDKRWAIARLFEYAPYPEIVRLLGYKEMVEQWPEMRSRIRSQSRKRGFDFLVDILKWQSEMLLSNANQQRRFSS